MLVIPGVEYISSCLWPFRSIYSIAVKSFLSSTAFFLNSDLNEKIFRIGKRKVQSSTNRANLLKLSCTS